jgi:hypothetical protein
VARFESDYHTCNLWRFGVPDGPDLPGFVRLDDGLIPPQAVCHWEDGRTLDNVPSYVNPGLAVLVAMLAATSVIVIVQSRRGTLRLRC